MSVKANMDIHSAADLLYPAVVVSNGSLKYMSPAADTIKLNIAQPYLSQPHFSLWGQDILACHTEGQALHKAV